ncbi:MAG: aldo/keto reductase [Firmicutes bacterium]|nr:aldo/keto reductase [Bacillota bacterium]
MNYRVLGMTGLKVSEIGFGAEWLDRHSFEEGVELVRYAHSKGINIIDCWMPDPHSRDVVGEAIYDCRDEWIIQGHIGPTWQDEQYVRTRDMAFVKPAFEDLLARLRTDYIDIGMMHYIDYVDEWNRILESDYFEYVKKLHADGVIRHIGMSTHNPQIAKLAAETDFIELIMFSINPAFDMLPANENMELMFEADHYESGLAGIEKERMELYQLCERNNKAITVMKGYFGGRLFDEKLSPFGVAMTPVQCIHYALTKPAVASIMCGYDTTSQVDDAVAYETASTADRDYASVLANAPNHSYKGQCTYCGHCKPCVVGLDIAMINKFYDLAVMQPEIPATVRDHYLSLGSTASDCIGCKECETRCPFDVSIADRMLHTTELFGV